MIGKSTWLRKFTVLLMAFAIVVAYSVVPVNQTFAASKKPTKITLKATSKTVDIKGKVTVSVKSVKPKGASKKVTYKSSNKKIATVNSKGEVKGKKKGTVKITVTSKANKKVKKTIKIKVKNLKPKKLKLSKSKATIAEGSTLKLKAKVTPTGVYAPVTWKTSNSKVATVSKGKVKAVAPGTATITAYTTKKKAGKKLSAKCKITVTEERTVFVDAAYVKDVVDNKPADTVIAEVSWGPDAPEELIPGAIHVNTDDLESNAQDDGYELWDMRDSQNGYKKLMAALASYGITKDTSLICYGWGSTNSAPTRLAMAALMMGVKDVKVLDGGTEAWFNAGYEKAAASEPVAAASFGRDEPLHPDWVVDCDQVVDKVKNDKNFKLVSIRSYDEFIGKNSGYGYIDKAGEPLGAIWGRDTDDGSYFSNGKTVGVDKLNEYLADYGASTDNELAFYCGTGWRATIPFLICYQAGIDNMKLFDDGWYVYSGAFADEWNWVDGKKPSKAAKDYPVQIGDPKKGSVTETTVSKLEGKYTSVNISAKSEELEVHGAGTIASNFTLRPGKTYAVKFESSNPDAVKVNDDGSMTIEDPAKADGVTVTATSNATYGSTPDKEGAPHSASFVIKAGTSFVDMSDEEWAKYGISVEDLTNSDVLVDVRPNQDSGYVPGAIECPVSNPYSEEQKEAIKKVYDEAEGRIVIVCVSGNKLARNAMAALEVSGADMNNVTYLIGGFNNGWSKSMPVVSADKKSVSVPAWVTKGNGPDGKLLMLKDADGNPDPAKADLTHHILVNENGSNAPAALLNTKALPLHVYNALSEIGGTPCDKFNKADAFDADGKALVGAMLPSDAQKINISFEYGDTTATLADFLYHVKESNSDITDSSKVTTEEFKADMRFGGCMENIQDKFDSPSGNQTGCITCTFSCWIGTVSNAAYGYSTQEALVNRAVVPAAETPVTVVYTLGK